jgi:hypothetical protein
MNLASYVETKEHNIDINILGLRQLASFGLLPVKKAFIKFNVKTLMPAEKRQVVKDVFTEPKSTGPNPNINTVISMAADLPIDKLYAPSL